MSADDLESTGTFGSPPGGNRPWSNALLGEQRRQHGEAGTDEHEDRGDR